MDLLGGPQEALGGRWAVVLAGGEGSRLSAMIQRWLGSHRPKQYCAFTGRKTMLEHTLERAGRLVPRENILTVIGPGHRRFLGAEEALSGRILEQPANLDTAPGIFFPLAQILSRDPSATVLIFPSDHYIAPGQRFIEHVVRAARLAEQWSERLVLLGAVPDRPEPEFGWIKLAHPAGRAAVAQVTSFDEKPRPERAQALYKQGALWNTMIMAVKASVLWGLGRLCAPEMMRGFEELRAAVGTPGETAALSSVYGRLRPVNFSKDILERSCDRAVALSMDGVVWHDWGRPERIRETLARVRKQPALPPGLMEALAAGRA
jgi:mannose-1-phosphate guanylyltransferase